MAAKTKQTTEKVKHMKNGIRRWLTLAIVPVETIMMLGVASPAFADACTEAESEPDGSISISISGNCNIPIDLTAKDDITITVTNGTLDAVGLTSNEGKIIIMSSGKTKFTGDIKADNEVEIKVTDGKLTTKKVESTNGFVKLESEKKDVETKAIDSGFYLSVKAGVKNGGSNGDIEIKGTIKTNTLDMGFNNSANVLLMAQGNIKTKSIKTNGNSGAGSSSCGGIQISPNLSTGNDSQFVIGTQDTENGVNGTLDVRSVNGGGLDPTFIKCGVRVVAGSEGDQGGIDLQDMGSIAVKSTNSRSGIIELNARDGVLKLPMGKLSAEGAANNSAGFIALIADKIETQDGTVISASQDDGAPPTEHGISISAESIEFTGTDGLKVESDGRGLSVDNRSTVTIVPKGGLESSSTDDAFDLLWTYDLIDFFQKPGNLNFNGTQSAKLVIRADGDNAGVAISGYPLTFSGGELTISSKGKENHDIRMGYEGALSGIEGLAFDNFGDVTITASGKGANSTGGFIDIRTDIARFDAPDHVIKSNGPNEMGQSGDGGRIFFQATSVNLLGTSTAKFVADGSLQGTGNANITDAVLINITGLDEIFPLGRDPGTFQLTANGGSAGGNAGQVFVVSDDISAQTSRSINASALSGDGDGGRITLVGTFTQIGDNKRTLKAIGMGTGEGGRVFADTAFSFEVNKVIDVAGGDNLGGAGHHGLIELNDVQCRQWKTGFTMWPKFYWNCGGVDNPSIQESLAVGNIEDKLTNGHRSALKSNDYSFHLWSRADDMNKYYSLSVPTDGSFGAHIQSLNLINSWSTAVIGGNDVNVELNLRGHSMHEIGHGVDRSLGFPSQSFPFTQHSLDDQALIAGLPCLTVFGDQQLPATNFCANNQLPGETSWDVLKKVFIKQQNVNSEMFAFGFQRCSGSLVFLFELDFAEDQMTNINDYMETDLWLNGCPGTLP